MVSCPARSRRRTDGDGIWRRLCAHHYPHRQYDSVARIRADLPLFRIGPRHRGGGAVAVLGRPSPGLQGARDGEHSAIGAIDPSSIYTPREMLGTPVFYLMYVMFVLMAAGGLMATAQLAVIAKDFGVRHPGLYSRADAPGIDVCAVDGP